MILKRGRSKEKGGGPFRPGSFAKVSKRGKKGTISSQVNCTTFGRNGKKRPCAERGGQSFLLPYRRALPL